MLNNLRAVALGECGANMMTSFYEQADPAIRDAWQYFALDTNLESLEKVEARLQGVRPIQLGLAGIGSGMDPQFAARCYELSREQVAAAFADSGAVLLFAGLGKGTGRGCLPLAVGDAIAAGAIPLPVVAYPSVEGKEYTVRERNEVLESTVKALRNHGVRHFGVNNNVIYTDPELNELDRESGYRQLDSVIAHTLSHGLARMFQMASAVDYKDFTAKILAGDGNLVPIYGEFSLKPDNVSGGFAEALKAAWNEAMARQYYVCKHRLIRAMLVTEGAWPTRHLQQLKMSISHFGTAVHRLGRKTEMTETTADRTQASKSLNRAAGFRVIDANYHDQPAMGFDKRHFSFTVLLVTEPKKPEVVKAWSWDPRLVNKRPAVLIAMPAKKLQAALPTHHVQRSLTDPPQADPSQEESVQGHTIVTASASNGVQTIQPSVVAAITLADSGATPVSTPAAEIAAPAICPALLVYREVFEERGLNEVTLTRLAWSAYKKDRQAACTLLAEPFEDFAQLYRSLCQELTGEAHVFELTVSDLNSALPDLAAVCQKLKSQGLALHATWQDMIVITCQTGTPPLDAYCHVEYKSLAGKVLSTDILDPGYNFSDLLTRIELDPRTRTAIQLQKWLHSCLDTDRLKQIARDTLSLKDVAEPLSLKRVGTDAIKGVFALANNSLGTLLGLPKEP